jgi:O-antigen ligase
VSVLGPILVGILIYGVTTLWVPGRWAAASLQVAIFICTGWMSVWRALRRRPAAASPLPVLLLAMCGWGALQWSAGWSVVPAETADAVLYWLAAACLVWLGMHACEGAQRRRVFLKTVLAAGSTVCLLGLIQLYTSPGSVFWLFPSGYSFDVIGPFVSHNQYAAFVELLLPVALVFAMQERPRAHLYLLLSAGLVACVIASGSRAGTTVVLVEAVMVFLLQRPLSTGTRRKWASFAVLAAAFTVIVGYQYVWERFNSSRDPLEFRREFSQSSVAMVRARPMYGFGLGTWPAAYRQFAFFDPGLSVDHAHNEWLEWTAEGGLPALLLLAAIAAMCAPAALRSIWGLGVLAVFAHSLVDYPFARAGLASWIFVFMGALMAYTRERRPAGHPSATGQILALAAVPILALAILQAWRTAYADRLYWSASPAALTRAAALRPDRGEYPLALAQADPGNSIPRLRCALQLNPFLTDGRILLAAELEAQGDAQSAESALLECARRDRQYAPAWALTNYYFRAGETEQFWKWARVAAQTSPGEMHPLFDLCFRMTADSRMVRQRLLLSRPRAERDYLVFLAGRGDLSGAHDSALRIAARAGQDDRESLLEYVDRELANGHVDAATDIWNRLCRKLLLPYEQLQAGTLVNGDFSRTILNRGFDWRAAPAGCALTAQTLGGGNALELFLSGRQPESCEIYSQFLRLTAGARYVLRFQYQTGELPDPTGLQWSVNDAARYEFPASREWTNGEWRFRGGPAASRLVLAYRRSAGAVRCEGTALLRRVRLEEQ